MLLTIRQAKMDDVDALLVLTAQLGYQSTRCELAYRLEVILSSDKHRALVFQNNETLVVGWIVIEQRITLEGGDRAEITGLVVHDLARGQGVGKQLVQAAISWAHSKGLNKVAVSSNAQREGSHHFYKQMGFKQKKTSIQYIKYI
ncbi:GNAT family N-acetyltransferase [Pseudoalteromonas luteoviolacea]|uniref:N-acetyltransferase domain-containing protein n=1 Tax=Pseudoalteromonas luteoviolacea S4060-1 TaxID=1365257 RepID=A0A167JVR5_9GAMM|nr:GNAT family N-acetyltransferase [Pseudoalteromonas luteoviolacea]KZN61735.1 hypothetical protein N478_06620 [Pseudoalteromonas luteoviolacea S4060-1]